MIEKIDAPPEQDDSQHIWAQSWIQVNSLLIIFTVSYILRPSLWP